MLQHFELLFSIIFHHGCMRVEKIRATYCTPMRGHTISSSTYSICEHEFLKLLTSNQATWSVFNKFWYRCKHSLCSRRRHFHNTNLNYLPFRGTLLLDNGGSKGAIYMSFYETRMPRTPLFFFGGGMDTLSVLSIFSLFFFFILHFDLSSTRDRQSMER